MTTYFNVLASCLVIVLMVGLIRAIKGPKTADRMLSAQLFGTIGVSLFIILAVVTGQPALFNAALVLAVLTPVTLITFIKLSGRA